ncbi:MAG: YheC/YheD family endospore coat-associated protein [Symbiobacteriia bacterium]
MAKTGPVIGILTMERTPQNTPRPHYREMTALGAQQGLLVYAFAPRDIDWQRGTVRGFRALQPHGVWRRGPFPLPTIVYDQTKSRSLAGGESCRAAKARLVQRGAVLLGPGFLSKGQVSAILRHVPSLQQYLPETLPATSANVLGLLRRHPSVYVKHANGTLGFNVVRISRGPQGGFLWEAARGYRHTVRLRLAGGLSLGRRLAFARRGGWLVQQGIGLCLYHGRPADIRLLLQKDGDGRWQVTTAFAKVAAPGQVVTNIGAGGSLARLDDVLRQANQRHGWDSSLAELRQRLFRVGLLTAQALDEALGPLAELGIDVGLDAQGHAWLIEANGKYSRKVFSHSVRQLTIRRVFAYSQFLHGLRRHGAKSLPPVLETPVAAPPGPPADDLSLAQDEAPSLRVVDLASNAL